MGTSGVGRLQPIGSPPRGESFQTTRWTVVLAAADGGSSAPAEARAALEALCRGYWFPLYAFARRRGHAPDAAQDLVQGFFARLLEKDIVGDADPARGRFRAYLLGAFRHFLADQRDHESALKRGGGHLTLSRDADDAERRYALDAAHDLTPERLFDRHWAVTLLEHVLADLRAQMTREGKADLFERLKGYLTADVSDGNQAEAAADLGMSPGALRVALHRLRGRYRDRLLAHIADTVAAPGDVDDEVRQLFQAVRR